MQTAKEYKIGQSIFYAEYGISDDAQKVFFVKIEKYKLVKIIKIETQEGETSLFVLANSANIPKEVSDISLAFTSAKEAIDFLKEKSSRYVDMVTGHFAEPEGVL